NQTTYGMVRDIAVRLGLQAQACMNTKACTAGAYAVAWGADSIRSGQQSRVLCGGVDLISESILSGFYNLKLMADEKSRPFDIQQQGLVLGEAAAMLVLESEASWQARRVQPWAKLEGSGWFHEAYHMIAPEPQGLGRQHSMRRALSRTGRSVEDVGCVIANGYGTKKNDMAELEALQAIFGKTRTPITTLRPLLGHSRGAESVLDVAIAVLILQNQKIPAITNLEQPYPEYTLQLVKDKPQDAEVRVCLVNNFGFGGNTISTLVGEAGTEKRSHV
ncbi:hypothetical protein KAR34_11620, partial [bacterium]|nr:hypothetical protein [bacterium]